MVLFGDDPRALDAPHAWAAARVAAKDRPAYLPGSFDRSGLIESTLAALEAHTESGTPRLVVADWLAKTLCYHDAGAVDRVYATMPIGDRRGNVDRDGSLRSEPFTARPDVTLIAALKAGGVAEKTAQNMVSGRRDVARGRTLKRRQKTALKPGPTAT